MTPIAPCASIARSGASAARAAGFYAAAADPSLAQPHLDQLADALEAL